MDDDDRSGGSGESSPLLGGRPSINSGSAYLQDMGNAYGEASPSVQDSASSAFLRRKEAASGGVGQYESLGDNKQSDNTSKTDLDSSGRWLEVSHHPDHRREEHSTT